MYKPISTYTGRHFDPYHAVAADLDVRDIAHAQSLMTRANGHFPAFYSVGQHSLACAREALVRGEANQTALFCLLHDGAEAYMSDVTRPVKARLPEFVRAEEWLLALLFDTLVEAQPTPAQWQTVTEIDNAMLSAEFLHFTGEVIPTNAPPLQRAPDWTQLPFDRVEQDFLHLYAHLRG